MSIQYLVVPVCYIIGNHNMGKYVLRNWKLIAGMQNSVELTSFLKALNRLSCDNSLADLYGIKAKQLKPQYKNHLSDFRK